MVTVDGGVFEALLSNMVPGKTYQVTVSSVKGLEESDPSTDTVTTGRLSPLPTRRSITSAPWVVSHSLLPCVFSSFGPTAGPDGAQRHRHVGPVAVAAVLRYCGRLPRHLQRRHRWVSALFSPVWQIGLQLCRLIYRRTRPTSQRPPRWSTFPGIWWSLRWARWLRGRATQLRCRR